MVEATRLPKSTVGRQLQELDGLTAGSARIGHTGCMPSKRTRRTAVRRARWTAAATAAVTGGSAAAGFGQYPNLAQIFFLFGASALSGWLAWQGASPPGGWGVANKKGLSPMARREPALI